MQNLITYGIIKTYKGLFRKTHVGNEQFLIVPSADGSFFVLNLIGSMPDGRMASQMILRMASELRTPFIDHFSSAENFIQVESVSCTSSIPKSGEHLIKLVKPGKFIQSDLNIVFDIEYSGGDIKIYMIDGKISLVMDEELRDATQLKMVARRKRANTTGLFRGFLSKLKG